MSEKTPSERMAERERKTVRTTVQLTGFDPKRRALIEAEMRKAGIEVIPPEERST